MKKTTPNFGCGISQKFRKPAASDVSTISSDDQSPDIDAKLVNINKHRTHSQPIFDTYAETKNHGTDFNCFYETPKGVYCYYGIDSYKES